jgi:hypothetical protein
VFILLGLLAVLLAGGGLTLLGGQASILRGSGVLAAGENSDDVASGRAARVAGREEAATPYGGPSLAANMDYYNIRVNVTLW